MLRVRGLRSNHNLRTLRYAVSLGAIAVGLAACSSARPSTSVAPVPSCVAGEAQPGVRDTLSLAAMAPMDPSHVPTPTNAAERLVFAQLYETLIGVDCDGKPRPGLAASWSLDSTRTRVILVLRNDARFWTGKPVTASDILSAWRATAAQSTAFSRLAGEIATGTTIVDEHTLIVSLPDTAWLVLADAALSLYRPQPTSAWPEGTGPYRIADNATGAPTGALMLAPSASSSDPYLTIRRTPSGDPRDAIDAGADVVVTDDRTAVAYAATRPNLTAVALPWTRTYALAAPGEAPKTVSALLQPDSESLALRASLAHDAVRAESRAAQPPYWWEAGPTCGPTVDSSSATRAPGSPSSRIVYRRDDLVARGLAERLVALDPRTVAAGLAPNDFARALRNGGELAYVLDLPRLSLASCDDLARLRSAAPWLASGAGVAARLVPLIDIRESAILNRQRVSATFDWRGTLHFGSVGSVP